MKQLVRTILLLTGAATQTLGAAAVGDTPQLVSVQHIWGAAKHNAFTDLIRFRGEWFCTFRESAAHVGGNGRSLTAAAKLAHRAGQLPRWMLPSFAQLRQDHALDGVV